MTEPSAWPQNGVFRSGAGGMRIKVLSLGEGPAAPVLPIHFIGWIDQQGARGSEIFNSRNRGRPVPFVIGTDGVMQGWNEGVIGM